jgi:transcriptional regulator with XRE-family HTH domain
VKRDSLYGHEHKELFTLLRDMRLEAGLSQREVVEILDRPQSYLSAVEIGGRGIDLIMVRELCKIYGVPFVQFAERLEERIKTKESRRRPPRRPRRS